MTTHVASALQGCLESQFPGFVVTQVEHVRTRGAIVGLVGLRGAGRYGSVGIAVPPEAAPHVIPKGLGVEVDLRDWIAELANMMHGRARLSLGMHSVILRASTPVVIENADMHIRCSDTVHVSTLRAGEHELSTWFDVGFLDARLDHRPTPGHANLFPGQVVLFT